MTDLPTPERFVHQLIERVPDLQLTFNDHVEDNGELLPHVLFGDVSRYVVKQVRESEDTLTTPIGRILECLEHGMTSGDDQIRNLILASFVENLVEYTDVLARLETRIGPKLKNEFRRIKGKN